MSDRLHRCRERRVGNSLAHPLRRHRSLLRFEWKSSSGYAAGRTTRGVPREPRLDAGTAPRCGEVFFQKACDKLRIPIVAGRRANFTRPHRGFPACHYCGACGEGCDTASFFNSADHLIPFALETGNLENPLERRRRAHPGGRSGSGLGVQYFDRQTGAERQVSGRVIVLGASAMDSTRILLNSISARFPNGLGNGSDQLGRNFCEQIMVHVRGFLPQLFGGATSTMTASAASTSTCRDSTIVPSAEARLPSRLRNPVLEHGSADHGRRRRPAPPRIRRRLQGRGEEALSGAGVASSFRRSPVEAREPGHR